MTLKASQLPDLYVEAQLPCIATFGGPDWFSCCKIYISPSLLSWQFSYCGNNTLYMYAAEDVCYDEQTL